jgi:hypothetical protein
MRTGQFPRFQKDRRKGNNPQGGRIGVDKKMEHRGIARYRKVFLFFHIPRTVKTGEHIPHLGIDASVEFAGFPFPRGAYTTHHIGAIDPLIVQGGKGIGRFAGIKVQEPDGNRCGSYVQGKSGAPYGFSRRPCTAPGWKDIRPFPGEQGLGKGYHHIRYRKHGTGPRPARTAGGDFRTALARFKTALQYPHPAFPAPSVPAAWSVHGYSFAPQNIQEGFPFFGPEAPFPAFNADGYVRAAAHVVSQAT